MHFAVEENKDSNSIPRDADQLVENMQDAVARMKRDGR